MTTRTATRAAIATAMSSVTDQDAALSFCVGTLGWEVRSDVRSGADGQHRWLEVAPPGSVARLALRPMGVTPGGAAIGVEVDDASPSTTASPASAAWTSTRSRSGRRAHP